MSPKYTYSATMVGLLGADWRKRDLNRKTIIGYCPVLPPTKNNFNFFIIIAKARHLRTLFM